jgi:hypothetical protein
MDKMLKLGQKMFGVVAGVALLLGVLAAPIGEVKANPDETIGNPVPCLPVACDCGQFNATTCIYTGTCPPSVIPFTNCNNCSCPITPNAVTGCTCYNPN